MRKLFLMVSAIETKKELAFNFGNTRSYFDNDERFRQTLFSLNSLRAFYPDDKIVVLDTSVDNCEEYKQKIAHFNAEYIAFKDIDPEAHQIVTTHPSINLCECTMLNSYFRKYKSYIKEFDFLIKTTGRYAYANFYNTFTEENKNKFFFKKPWGFEWNNNWRYDHIDLRSMQQNNLMYQYCTVLYGFGTSQLQNVIDMFDAHNHIVRMTLPHINYDIESLSYYLTRPFVNDIIETDWKIMGFEGVHGRLMFY